MEIKKVAVLGAGTMGNQIAMKIAISGFETVCYSRSEKTVAKAGNFSERWFAKAVAKERMTQENSDAAQNRLTFTTELKDACENADLVIETVAELLDVKRRILKDADMLTPDHTIYASNSSYVVSSKFADVVKNPGNVCNLHFFNPVLMIKVVEVVKGPHSSDATMETIGEFTKQMGMDPVFVEKEIYGFVVNRIFSALTREACLILDLDIASVEDIDKAVKGALGHPMGPFELLDMTGIDLEYNVYMEKFADTLNPADRPASCLATRYDQGMYGRKTKKGFYKYD